MSKNAESAEMVNGIFLFSVVILKVGG